MFKKLLMLLCALFIAAPSMASAGFGTGIGITFPASGSSTKTIGNTYADNLEELIDSYFEKANVTPQNTSVVFNENGTFSRSVADRKANGTWMVNGDQVLTAIKNIQFGCMTSRLENDTLTLVVPVKRIMTALQELGGISDSKTNTTIVKLTKHLKGFQAGFLLTRKKK